MAAQHRADTGIQFLGVERLGQVVIGAGIQAFNALGIIALCGEHDDRHDVLGLTQATADRQAIFPRQHQVQHHQGIQLAGQGTVHLLRIAHRLYRIASFFQKPLQQATQSRIVIHDQNLVLLFAHGTSEGLLVPDLRVVVRTCKKMARRDCIKTLPALKIEGANRHYHKKTLEYLAENHYR